MKFRVINGGRKGLEDKVIRDMSEGRVCAADLDRLRPWGKLYLVKMIGGLHTKSSDSEKNKTRFFGS